MFRFKILMIYWNFFFTWCLSLRLVFYEIFEGIAYFINTILLQAEMILMCQMQKPITDLKITSMFCNAL